MQESQPLSVKPTLPQGALRNRAKYTMKRYALMNASFTTAAGHSRKTEPANTGSDFANRLQPPVASITTNRTNATSSVQNANAVAITAPNQYRAAPVVRHFIKSIRAAT
jgi:hypothetical protein